MRLRHRFAAFGLAVCLATTADAQLIEDAGPHLVGYRDRNFSHALAVSDPVSARFFYPAVTAGLGAVADPSQGPYPVVALVHGSGTFPNDYDLLCNHLASWGFVVASVGTVADFTSTIPADMQAMLHYTEEEGLEPTSFLFDMPSSDDWTAIGHSSGGMALFHLAQLESRVRWIVALEPSWAAGLPVETFDGDFLVVGATDDVVTPPGTHAKFYYDGAEAAARRFYVEVQGGGHNGVLDVPFGPVPPLPHDDQHAVHRRATTGFLRAEVFGEVDLYQDILGAGNAAEPFTADSNSVDPPQWVVESSTQPGKLAWGFARQPGDYTLWMAASGTASLPTEYGELGLDPLSLIVVLADFMGTDGVAEMTVPIGPALSGLTFYFQGISVGLEGGALTETASYTFP